ncbi:YbjN domain-containing protein [Dyadobacter diqingensis]|uniref:YbjN domain-containing protein n=1 Tax=Dyadobacter diqingensis TaxID=2938121 RepID=UPI0020C18D39|nr:YbjN domain-containing protein [Dyadobacter diqingensis]
MCHILNSIEEVLVAKGFDFDMRFDAEQNQHLFILNFPGENGRFALVWTIIQEHSQMMLVSTFPIYAPKAAHSLIITMLNRINITIRLGSFELDEKSGHIRLRHTFYFNADLPFSEKLVMDNLAISLVTMDQRIPEIMSVMHAGQSNKSQSALPFWCN